MFVFKLKAQYLYPYFYVSQDSMILCKKEKSMSWQNTVVTPDVNTLD